MQAVIDWARQYDDMSQSQMSAIFAELGYQFDQGAWCADFVRMALGDAIGDENLREDMIDFKDNYYEEPAEEKRQVKNSYSKKGVVR